MIPEPLERLIKDLGRLPGIGKRSAQRAALHLLTDQADLTELEHTLAHVKNSVKTCQKCHNISLSNPCHICSDNTREQHTLCVVEGVDDLWALERSGAFNGLYHVLGGVISAIDGVRPEDLTIPKLISRVQAEEITEVILALSASIDGSTTGHLIARRTHEVAPQVKITTLARGIPMGANVDYLDDSTLTLALNGRIDL